MLKGLKRLAAAGLACLCLLTVLPVPARAAVGFSDVPASYWAAESITRAAKLGLINGRSDGTFGVGQSMTRAAFVAVLCRLFQWELVSPASGTFPDNQNSSKWYYSAVETACLHGAVTQQEQNFRPGDTVTRQEMAVMLVRALGYGTLASLVGERTSPFTDVTSSLGYLILANDLGIMTGNTRGAFQPDKTATREQAAVVLMRVYDKLHAAATDVCGVARSAESLSLDGVGTVAVPAVKIIYNGNLQIISDLSAETVSAIRAATEGKHQLMQITGTSSGFSGTDAAELAEKIAAAAKEGGWDGVLLDIPKLPGTEKKSYTNLVTALRSSLGTDALLYVTAEAPTWQGKTAYNGYDFAALAAQADKVILRVAAYSQIVSGLPSTPREPLEEVYYALEAVASAIPAEKRVIQLTASGTAWRGETAEGDVSATEISVLLSTSGVTGYWSGRYAEPYLSYTDSGVRVVVWYNDARAAQARRQLLTFFGGGGLCISDLAGPLDGENGILTGLK
ncbi:putative surface layer protein [Oscillibacter valericigenes Sjm18-20]|nr:putative surface layer protein [Oscillibacter valericigenes Sjm18-20]